MTTIASYPTTALSPLPSYTAVPTTVIHLSARQALDFADYLESQKLTESLLDQHILDCAVFKEPSEGGFFLDQALIAQASSEAVEWVRDHRCHRFPGCRLAYAAPGDKTVKDLLADYQGTPWKGYAVVAASALEIAIVLELCECPCLLQLELLEQ